MEAQKIYDQSTQTHRVLKKIRQHLEFLFSEVNLMTDEPLRKQQLQSRGKWVDCSFLLKGRIIKHLIQKHFGKIKYKKRCQILQRAVKNSASLKFNNRRIKRYLKISPNAKHCTLYLQIADGEQVAFDFAAKISKQLQLPTHAIKGKPGQPWCYLQVDTEEAATKTKANFHQRPLIIENKEIRLNCYSFSEMQKFQEVYKRLRTQILKQEKTEEKKDEEMEAEKPLK